ncbi:MAG: biotin-dependent carboxyltransferase family protein [Candidatus Bathyarchaeota archaeon]|nr:MAG: biotin-dependent carboxyltransferase family protein [Candidatus Bathyarchaeota archaeon]
MKLCRVAKPGFFTTVQDLGRYGFHRYGVPISGAMDAYSFVVANLLVDNNPQDAGFEITLVGPRLEFLAETEVAITGADLSPTINGELVCLWRTLQILDGDVLSFGPSVGGCRAYLAARGGIDVPSVLGSRSTYVRGSFGGFNGRELREGDIIGAAKHKISSRGGFMLPQELVPQYYDDFSVEVVLGPQSGFFTKDGLETFLSSTYTVTIESDRMGYRLDGNEIERREGQRMISDAIPVGAIQVPESGRPIIMMRDAQTTGGYPKISVVVTPDVSRLAQARPNDTVSFSAISLSNAREKYVRFSRAFAQIKGRLGKLKS